MLTIRLSRIGKKKHPIYRVIVSEKTKDTVGNYLELLGHYDPHTNKAELKAERIKHWLDHGAQTSGSIHNLLVENKIIEGEKIKVANIKKKKDDGKETEVKPAPAEKPTETKPVEVTKPEDKKEEASTEEKTEEKPVTDSKEEKPAEKPAEDK